MMPKVYESLRNPWQTSTAVAAITLDNKRCKMADGRHELRVGITNPLRFVETPSTSLIGCGASREYAENPPKCRPLKILGKKNKLRRFEDFCALARHAPANQTHARLSSLDVLVIPAGG